MFHIGPPRDASFFEGLPVHFVRPEEASVVVCTGFFHEERETVEDYNKMLSDFAARQVLMICANPDLVVERGNILLPCAGAIAQRYAALGQRVIQAGKPYRPIYDQAMGKLATPLVPNEILAIGDGIDTDIKGACGLGIDSVYIASRVHIANKGADETIDPGFADLIFANRSFRPSAAMTQLKW
jgi:HAD superfamily hydrolase (TIGR01459 family)